VIPRAHGRAVIPRARAAWGVLAVVAGALSVLALAQWAGALLRGGSVLYGEGAVAHAAVLLREGATYRAAGGPSFVAANYPPLYFALAAIGDPFVSGRLWSAAATLLVAALVAWRARRAGPLVAACLALSFVAAFPVMVWGVAVKPDLVALGLTVAAVVALDARRAVAAGALLALAVLAKPTALLPAIALLAWLAAADRALLVRGALGAAPVAAAGALAIVALGPTAVWTHVVTWNALPWDAGRAGLLALAGGLVLGAPLAAAALAGGPRGATTAYLAGAAAVAVLGGREGGTVNYLLDLCAATALALAAAAPRLGGAVPLALAAQLAVAAAVLDPFGIVPRGGAAAGAWDDPARGAAVRAAAGRGPVLAEDSGWLVASGRDPVVDDLFLWSRLSDAGLVDGSALIASVTEGRYELVAAAVDLEQLGAAPAYERARWSSPLVAAVLARYRLEGTASGVWLYRPR